MAREQVQQEAPRHVYNPAYNGGLGYLGSPDAGMVRGVHQASSMTGEYKSPSPQEVVQKALEGQNLEGLKLALMNDPQLLTNHPLLAAQLSRDSFFQQHRQEIVDAMRTPDPVSGETVPKERLALAAKLEGLTSDKKAHLDNDQPPMQRNAAKTSPGFSSV